ncbi:MAG TPA: Asp-tRNA(Asn)/Glu-tRNA(Gln) amidotransferase subunit GatA [Saprospiraceae bacterium]|nr:Asp-tRNA(Asn)/Glu-tRNA(Gln) amidotransferase subunit GatA [Saprospiraceae bacterium]HMQ84940.1 Asp-tRNA(Asn)/Glu-tRNA(Gln) amidotransferase subunit GatA [Saprospiraceae bacterium]
MPKYNSLKDIQEAISKEATTCLEVVQYYLSQIKQQEHLNAYVAVYEEEALEKARQIDQKRRENPDQLGRLWGMVISHKDVICYKNHGVTAGSKILNGFTSLFSATALERVLAEDAIIIGRVNCDEFAMGSSNENSYYGPVRNAADVAKIPGGSSGGSAVSVQADTCLASLGTDTGGSVRQPAAFCGLVGFKPSYGRISRYGLLAYGSSFDQIGILSHSVSDVAILLEVMAGADEYDSTASQKPVPAYSQLLASAGKKRIAYFPIALEHSGLDPEIKSATQAFIQHLEAAGHEVLPVDFEYLDYIVPTYYVLTTAEASSNLSRYDGIRFGYRSENATDLISTYKKSRTEGFGNEVKRRIMLGTFVLSSGYYDAYYSKAQKARRLIQDRMAAIFQEFDFILMPTSPVAPWTIGEKLDDPVAVYLADIFTVQANLAGIPAISIPAGQHSYGLPIGVQLMAARFEEAALLAFAQGVAGGE